MYNFMYMECKKYFQSNASKKMFIFSEMLKLDNVTIMTNPLFEQFYFAFY